MKYVYKLPIFISIICAIVAAILSLRNGKDVYSMAYDVSLVIVIVYPLGMIFKSVIIKILKEVIVRKYLLDQQEKQKRKKNQEAKSQFDIEA